MTISSGDRLNLAALLGMLGSDHVGERDNAAKLVEKFRQRHGLIWADLLASRLMQTPLTELPRPQPHCPPDSVDGSPIRRIHHAFWRWSLFAGLAAVGVLSLTTLMQPQATAGTPTIVTEAGAGCPAGMNRGDGTACEPTTSEAAPRGAATAPSSFSQGVADRQFSETWHKSTPAVLCAGPCPRTAPAAAPTIRSSRQHLDVVHMHTLPGRILHDLRIPPQALQAVPHLRLADAPKLAPQHP